MASQISSGSCRRLDRRSRLFPALCLAAALLACERGSGSNEDALDRASAAARIEALFHVDQADTSGADLLGNVRAARLTSDGARIIVLDEFEPFIKVMDREGRLIRSFAKSGQGPGELNNPQWLAVQGDSVIAVIGVNGLREFSLEGESLASVPPMPLYLTGLAEGCEGGWLVLGPKNFVVGTGEVTPWLREVARVRPSGDTPTDARVLFSDSVVSARYLRLPAMIASSGGHFAFLRRLDVLKTGPSGQVYEGTREFFEGDCTTGEVRRVDTGLAYAGPDAVRNGVGPGGATIRQVSMDPGYRHQGLGLLSAGILLARRAWDRPHLPTVLNLVGRSDSALVRVPEGVVSLEDARAGVGAVFSTNDPWPRIVFVPESLLLAALGLVDSDYY